MSHRFYAVLFFLFLCFNCVQAQPSGAISLDSLAGQFIRDIRSDPKEKIIVHTDKWFYEAGETIMFKAYCLNSTSNRTIRLSKNIWIDLVDDKDSLISQVLLNGLADRTAGQIILSHRLKEGYYWLRGYTTRMLRDDKNRILVEPLYIVNSQSREPRQQASNVHTNAHDTSRPQLLFFPEGGSLVSGARANVGFVCMDANGTPEDVSGYVSDTRDSIVARFSTSLPGTGKFSFDAWNPRKYTAHIKGKDGKDLSYPLPRINQFAYQLSLVDQNSQSYQIRVSLGDSLYKKNKASYILGVCDDSLCFAANGNDMYEATIPKSSFPKGKATFFLFDEQGNLQSQRSLFIDSGTHLSATGSQSAQPGGTRVDLALTGPDGKPVHGSISVAITDDRLPQTREDQQEYSDLHLEHLDQAQTLSWLEIPRGRVFSNEEMDLIMLTQKDQFPKWHPGLTHNNPKASDTTALEDSQLPTIRGIVLNKKNAPVPDIIVNLISHDKRFLGIDTTDKTGHFEFNAGDFEDGTPYGLKLTSLKGQSQDGSVILDTTGFPRFATPQGLKKRLDPQDLDLARRFRVNAADTATLQNGETLNPVTVKGDKEGEGNTSQTTRVSRFSYIIPGEKLATGDPNALLNEIRMVPGLNTGTTIAAGGSTMAETPLIVVDGVQQTLSSGDASAFLLSLDPMNIDYVEILKGPQAAIYGMQGAGGVILINSRNSRRTGSSINDKGLATVNPKGYAPQTDFPPPAAPGKKDAPKTAPEIGTTVFWKANVQTDPQGKAFIEFVTPEFPKRSYRMSLMAVTNTGEFIWSLARAPH